MDAFSPFLMIVGMFGVVNAVARYLAGIWFKNWYSRLLVRMLIISLFLPFILNNSFTY